MIRQANKQDLDQLLSMSKDFWLAGGPIDDWDAGYTHKKLESIIENHLILVSDNESVITGMIILVFVDHLCAPVVNACELAWYVRPEYRGSSIGIKLLQQAVEISRASGAKTMTLAYMERSMPDTIQSIYERLGFERNETSYLMRL